MNIESRLWDLARQLTVMYKEEIKRQIVELKKLSPEERISQRINKYIEMGVYIEV